MDIDQRQEEQEQQDDEDTRAVWDQQAQEEYLQWLDQLDAESTRLHK